VRESEFQGRIVGVAEAFGWQVWHVPAPMRWDPKKKAWVPAKEGAGLPDLILLHDDPPRLVFMELKTKGGKLSDRQREFLQAANEVAKTSAFFDGEVSSGVPTIGVFAAWPEDEERIERMLRTRHVA
jgi:hypothetical protein